jgi:putative MATE family efflux protein
MAAVVGGTTLLTALVGGAVVALAGWWLVPGLFAVMNTPPEVTEPGKLYLGTYLLGTPLLFGFFAVEAAFRAAGDTRTPMGLLGISVALNIVLDPLLIAGVGALPAMGIAGAAVAAVLTRGTVLAAGFVLLVRRNLVRLTVWDTRSALTVLRVGAPVALTGIFFSAVYIGLTRVTTQFGVPALAALGIGHKLEGLAYMVATGFALASSAIVGQNLGARRPDRARRSGWLTALYAA